MTESNDSPPEGIDVDQAFVCDGCGRRWYYTRSRCPGCGGRGISTYRLDRGELLAVTDIAVTPPDVPSPNRVGLARFGDVQLIAQLQEGASVGDTVVFAGEYRLRDGDEPTKPRLRSVD